MPVNLVLRVWVTAELVVGDWVHLADVYVGPVRKTKEQEASEGRQPKRSLWAHRGEQTSNRRKITTTRGRL